MSISQKLDFLETKSALHFKRSHVAGMDVEKYKTKWGGEDWDLLDRILQVGLEAERIKIPGFYHFYHTKKDMWNNGK